MRPQRGRRASAMGIRAPCTYGWARRPLAAARAVIFCQMVDDPSAVPEDFPTEEDQENERLRLFKRISELVTWENTTNEEVLERAREEIRRSWRRCCAGRRALLRPVDARRGREVHWPPVPKGAGIGRDGERSPRSRPLCGQEARCDCVDLGSHGQESKSGI